jgi:hypothetical protein
MNNGKTLRWSNEDGSGVYMGLATARRDDAELYFWDKRTS